MAKDKNKNKPQAPQSDENPQGAPEGEQPEAPAPEVQDDPPADVEEELDLSPAQLQALKAKIREEVIDEVRSGLLSVPRRLKLKNAKSELSPVRSASKVGNPESPVAEKGHVDDNEDFVEVDLEGERIYINGQEFSGKIVCKVHEARSIVQMIRSKKLADYESTIGRNFLSKKLANGALQITQVQSVNDELKKAGALR